MKKFAAALCTVSCLALCAAFTLPKPGAPAGEADSGYALTASAAYENKVPGKYADSYNYSYADGTLYKTSIEKVQLMRNELNEKTGLMNQVNYTEWETETDVKVAVYKITIAHQENNADVSDTTEYRLGFCYDGRSVLDYVAYQEVEIPEIQQEILDDQKIKVTDPTHTTIIAGSVYSGSYLKTVDLSKIVYISGSSFNGCKYITEVTIPSCVRFVGGSVFADSGLKTLNIKNEMVRIPSSMCANTKLTKITFAHPEYIRWIGSKAFANTPMATAIFENWDAKKVANYETMTIDEAAFSGCTSIEKLTLPDNVRIIYPEAFKGCTKLNTLKLGANVIGMDKQCFADCTALDTITFNKKLESLGGSCFAGCTSLKEVKGMPDKILDWEAYTDTTGWGFGNYVFQNCTALTKCELPKSITMIPEGIFAGCTALNWVNTDYNKDVITKIGADAFKNCIHLLDADYPNVEEIDVSAFENCAELQNAKYPKCTIVRKYAFSGCSGLTSFKVAHCTMVGSYALQGCSKLTSIVLESDKYNNYTFKDCTAAKTITIYCDNMNVLPYGTFSGCTALTEVKGDLSKIEVIQESNFERCSSLVKITFANLRIIEKNAFADCEKLQSIGIKAIKAEDYGEKCFYNCAALNAEVNGNISTIGTSAFDNSGITKVDVNGMVGGTVVIGDSAFANCQKLTSASIISPDGNVYSVGTAVFKNCPKLGKAVYAGPIITKQMFMDCTSLETMQTDATQIYESGFENCAALKMVTDRVETKKSIIAKDLGGMAFSGCASLTVAPTDENTNYTDKRQFYGCASLKTAKVGMLTTAMFRDCVNLTAVDFPPTTEIPSSCFRGCTKFEGIDLKDVLTINQYAFAGTAFKEVKISDAQTIGAGAFEGCAQLAKVDVTTVTLGESAFAGCEALTDAKVTAETILQKAFQGDTMLTNITLKDTDSRVLKNIGDYAFDSCSALRTLIIPGSPLLVGSHAFGYVGGVVNPDFLVVGVPDSAVHSYANYNKIAFADISTYDPAARDIKATPGDVDGNGVVAVADAVKLSKYLVGTETAINAGNSDLNGDKKINAVDLSLLKRKILSRSSK